MTRIRQATRPGPAVAMAHNAPLLLSSVAVLALALLLLLPAMAGAQARRPVTIGLGGGGTVPIADFANDVKTGWHGSGFLQFAPVLSPWAVRGEVQYHRTNYTDDFLDDVGALPDADLYGGIVYAGASALFRGRSRTGGFSPYLIGGVGLYRLTATLSDGSGLSLSDSENGFGFNGGAGIEFGRAGGVFVEARFHQFSVTPDLGEKSTSQFIPVTLGIRF